MASKKSQEKLAIFLSKDKKPETPKPKDNTSPKHTQK